MNLVRSNNKLMRAGGKLMRFGEGKTFVEDFTFKVSDAETHSPEPPEPQYVECYWVYDNPQWQPRELPTELANLDTSKSYVIRYNNTEEVAYVVDDTLNPGSKAIVINNVSDDLSDFNAVPVSTLLLSGRIVLDKSDFTSVTGRFNESDVAYDITLGHYE